MFVDLLKAQREAKADVSSLEIGLTGGAICTPTMYEDFRTELGLRAINVIINNYILNQLCTNIDPIQDRLWDDRNCRILILLTSWRICRTFLQHGWSFAEPYGSQGG